MNKTTENLISVLKSYNPPETVTVIYRLVYDVETGKPVAVTTDPTDQPHINISQEEASAQPQLDPRVRVENGKLVRHLKRLESIDRPNVLKLISSSDGNIVTDDYNMLIINSKGNNRWRYD